MKLVIDVLFHVKLTRHTTLKFTPLFLPLIYHVFHHTGHAHSNQSSPDSFFLINKHRSLVSFVSCFILS